MDLETRFKNVVLVLQGAGTMELTSREVAKSYLPDPTSSDALTTGNILNMMSLLGYVDKIKRFKVSGGRAFSIKYRPTEKVHYVKVV